MEIGNWEINYFPDFNFQREIENARNALYFTRILYRGNIFLCPGGMGNVVFYLYLHHGGGRAKMTEATQTTFFRDFFGKEMSENSGLATQYLLVYSDAVPGSIFRRWSRPMKAFFTRSPWSGLSDFHLPHVCAV